MIELTIDQEASADKEIINLASYGEVYELVEFSESHFIRIDQDGEFFLPLLSGFGELRIDLCSAGIHCPKIRKEREPFGPYIP